MLTESQRTQLERAKLRKMDGDLAIEKAYLMGRKSGLETALSVIPGGSICDPQQIADEIRALICES